MKRLPLHSVLFFLLFSFLILAGCASGPRGSTAAGSSIGNPSGSMARADSLVLNFTGDIMAHTVNYSVNDYGLIYADVRQFLHSADLSFGNLEMPVDDDLPLSSYPRFNVHTPYVKAAADAGFSVLSLANNHANDQGAAGIEATRAALASLAPDIVSCGLRTDPSDRMEPVVIRKNGWTVLFLAVTEILNSDDDSGRYVYYVEPTESARSQFLADLVRMRAETPCDLFVLSIHVNEPEYVRTVNDAKKEWFDRLAEAGVDIVWGNHPHVLQQWETGTAGAGTDVHPVLFMYSMGNFISGQRFTPDQNDPSGAREYTGDGVILRVTMSGSSGVKGSRSGYSSLECDPLLITTYIDPDNGPVVRRFDKQFVSTLPASWQRYYNKRLDLMKAYLPLLPPAPVTGILK